MPEQGHQGGQVAGHYALPITVGHDDAPGMTQPQRQDPGRLTLEGSGDSLGTFDRAPHPPEGFLEAEALVQTLLYQVSDYLGIRVRGKGMSRLLESGPQLQEVFHDAVVHHCYPAMTIGMGMGVDV